MAKTASGKTATTNKTMPTAQDVDGFIDALPDARQREDAHVLRTLMEEVSNHKATLWGPSIIGFGAYHYTYASGRSGTMCRIGFSPRKGKIVVYLLDGYAGKEATLKALGPHKLGKSCLYIRSLADIDLGVLKTLLQESLAWMAKEYAT